MPINSPEQGQGHSKSGTPLDPNVQKGTGSDSEVANQIS